MERPAEINKSILEGDKQHLRNAGKKGAFITNQIKELSKIKAEEKAQQEIEQLERDLREAEESRNGDPID